MNHQPHALTLAVLAGALFASMPAYPRGGGHGGGAHSSHTTSSFSSDRGTYAAGVPRDSNGRIARSDKAKTEFKKLQPCRATGSSSGACPGYVIDHLQPLKRGGADAPYNMQWQTKEEARIRDQAEWQAHMTTHWLCECRTPEQRGTRTCNIALKAGTI